MKGAIVITGAAGGIGSAVAGHFKKLGYFVIATDSKSLAEPTLSCDARLLADLSSPKEVEELCARVKEILKKNKLPLAGLINNAALQIVKDLESCTSDDWFKSFTINLFSPWQLATSLLSPLREAQGSIVNISSIHHELTKSSFGIYAATKAALSSLTRSMAIEWGQQVKVFALAPAAIETDMLRDGFEEPSREASLKKLNDLHPTGCIGKPEDVAVLCEFLITRAPTFLTGSIIPINGGIGGVLHD